MQLEFLKCPNTHTHTNQTIEPKERYADTLVRLVIARIALNAGRAFAWTSLPGWPEHPGRFLRTIPGCSPLNALRWNPAMRFTQPNTHCIEYTALEYSIE